jgi:hypothetical protein
MHKKLTDMKPVDDFVTRATPGLKIWEENWGGMQCAYHVFAPGTDFTDILKGKGLEHDLCGVEHWAYVLKGTVEVIYLDGSVDVCTCWGMLLLAGSAQLQVDPKGPRSSSSAPREGWLRKARESRSSSQKHKKHSVSH